MIKYILHGGADKINNKNNNEFYREITRGQTGEVNILMNFFSRFSKEIPERFELRKVYILKNLEKNSGDVKLNFKLADEEHFLEQLKWADIMYVCGGDSSKLIDIMRKFPEFIKLLDGKVIAGCSAGTYFLTKYFYENDEDRIEEGLGVLDIKAFCHFDEEKKMKEMRKLIKYKEDLPVLTLQEHKWTVMYK